MAEDKQFWSETPEEETTQTEEQTPEEETPGQELSESEEEQTSAEASDQESTETEETKESQPEKTEDRSAKYWQSKYQERDAELKKVRMERALGQRRGEQPKAEEKPEDEFYDNPREAIRSVLREERELDRWDTDREKFGNQLDEWAKQNNLQDELQSAMEYIGENVLDAKGNWPVKGDGSSISLAKRAELIQQLALGRATPIVAEAAAAHAKAEAEAKHERKLGRTTPQSDGGGAPPKSTKRSIEQIEYDEALAIGTQSAEAKDFFSPT